MPQRPPRQRLSSNELIGTLEAESRRRNPVSRFESGYTWCVSLLGRVPRSVRAKVHEFVDGVRIAFVRAGCRQVIDITVHCSREVLHVA